MTSLDQAKSVCVATLTSWPSGLVATSRQKRCEGGRMSTMQAARRSAASGSNVREKAEVKRMMRVFRGLTVGVSGEHSEAVRVHCTPG